MNALRFATHELRINRSFLIAWLLPLWSLPIIFVPAYQSYYPSIEDRTGLINGMQINLGMRAMYGRIYDPGTLGQLMAWEGAGWLLILSSVMSVLLLFRCYRHPEVTSRGELPRAVGLSRLDIASGTLMLLTGVCLALGLGIAAIMALLGQIYGEITGSGSIAYGLAIGLAALGSAVLAAAASLLAHGNFRRLGLLLLGAGYMSRALADVQDLPFFSWITPLGWFGLVRPFTDDRFWVLGIGLLLTAVVAAAWLVGERGREFGMAIVPERTHKPRPPRNLTSPWRLRLTLDRGFHVTWVLTAFVLSAFMASLSSSMDELLQEDENTGQIFKQMFGDINLEVAFLTYMGDFLGIVVCVAAVASVLKLRTEERERFVDLMRAQGISRRLPMQLQTLSSGVFIGELALAMTAGSLIGVLSQSKHTSDVWRTAAAANAAQVAPMLALAGLTALLIGLCPKQAWVAWLPIIYSGLVTIVAPLFQAPEWLLKTSAFGHTIYPDHTDGWASWLTLVVVGLVAGYSATIFAGRREIP